MTSMIMAVDKGIECLVVYGGDINDILSSAILDDDIITRCKLFRVIG